MTAQPRCWAMLLAGLLALAPPMAALAEEVAPSVVAPRALLALMTRSHGAAGPHVPALHHAALQLRWDGGARTTSRLGGLLVRDAWQAAVREPAAWKPAQDRARARALQTVGAVALGLGGAAGAAAGIVALLAQALRNEAYAHEPPRDLVDRDRHVHKLNAITAHLTIGAVTAGGSGALLLLWPADARGTPPPIAVAPVGRGVCIKWRVRF